MRGDALKLVGLRLLAGSALLIAPRRLLARLDGGAPDRATVAAARLLGARHLAEAALLARHRNRRVLLAGALVDAVHAISMLALASLDRRRRRAAAASAVGAAGFAAAGCAAAARLRAMDEIR